MAPVIGDDKNDDGKGRGCWSDSEGVGLYE